VENVRSALGNGDPVIVLESGDAGNLHWSVATGLGFPMAS
jgi:hypothetical protein